MTSKNNIWQKISTVQLIIVASVGLMQAQINSYNNRSGFAIERKLGKINPGAETERRSAYDLRLTDHWSRGIDANYKVAKFLKTELDYKLMTVLDEKYFNYQLGNEINTLAIAKLKINRFTVSLQEGFQARAKDEYNKMSFNGSINSYKINLAFVWRNKGSIDYYLPNTKMEQEFSVENFYDLNKPYGNDFSKLKYLVELYYKFNPANDLSVSEVLTNRKADDHYDKEYILGLNYNINL